MKVMEHNGMIRFKPNGRPIGQRPKADPMQRAFDHQRRMANAVVALVIVAWFVSILLWILGIMAYGPK